MFLSSFIPTPKLYFSKNIDKNISLHNRAEVESGKGMRVNRSNQCNCYGRGRRDAQRRSREGPRGSGLYREDGFMPRSLSETLLPFISPYLLSWPSSRTLALLFFRVVGRIDLYFFCAGTSHGRHSKGRDGGLVLANDAMALSPGLGKKGIKRGKNMHSSPWSLFVSCRYFLGHG